MLSLACLCLYCAYGILCCDNVEVSCVGATWWCFTFALFPSGMNTLAKEHTECTPVREEQETDAPKTSHQTGQCSTVEK